MLGDVDVNDPPALMHQHDEDEQDAARQGRDGEEIDRRQRGDVIRQKRAPRLGRRTARSPQEPRDGSLRDRDAHSAQFAMDPRRSPQRIRGGHLAHQRANGGIGPWAARTHPRRAPRPSPAEPFAMPSHHGVGLDEHERRAPVPPRLGQYDPKQPIARCGVADG